MTKNQNKLNLNQDKLHLLSEKLMDRIEELLEYLDVKLMYSRKMYYGACPIHGGDNISAFNLFHDGHSYRGNWKCRTMQCETHFKGSIIGFVRGVLSHQKHGWSGPDDKFVSFKDTVDFILKFLNEDYDQLSTQKSNIDKKRFIQSTLNTNIQQKEVVTITRNQVRKTLQIPPEYYIKRNYSQEILDNYDIGLCNNRYKQMYNRIVVPVYDAEKRYMVGCTGRSIFERCPKCGCYHAGNCPPKLERYKFSKWKNSKNFRGENYLYNYWNAKKHIIQDRVVIIVEGPGDVWRLEEAGIHYGLGLFGTSLTGPQKALLDSSGALAIMIIMDADDPGRDGAKIIREQCERLYHISTVDLCEIHDIGDMSVDDINEKIRPQLLEMINKVKI